MRHSAGLAKLLQTLLTDGAVPLSQISAAIKRSLATQFESGILQIERAGAGSRVVVKNKEVLSAFAAQLFPSGLALPDTAGLSRSDAIGHYRDAKVSATAMAEPVLLRAFNNAVLTRNGAVFPIAKLSDEYGVASFLLQEPPIWGYSGTLAIVENLESFLCFEKMNIAADVAVYAGGKMSGRMLAWFASANMGKCELLHCGDYDPVGIAEYLRLKEACGNRAKLFIPQNLEELFKKFGKRELLEDSEAVLRRLRSTTDPDALRVIALMNIYNTGLEQEILLLDPI